MFCYDEQTFVSSDQHLPEYGNFAPRVHNKDKTRSYRVVNAEQILDAFIANHSK